MTEGAGGHLVHPEHDAVAATIRSWFTTSLPEIGLEVEERWFGYSTPAGTRWSRVILTVETPDRIPAALHEIGSLGAGEAVAILVDDRRREALLEESLLAGGCERGHATTHLALVGGMTGESGPAGLVIEGIPIGELEEWASIKLRCFGNTEDLPSPEVLAAEVAVRQTEGVIAEYQVATLAGEPVGVLAYYHGDDQLVFNLGTRMPYRHRGVAQAMLAHWVAAGMADGCRSLIINADDPGRPAELYKRLGFVDEVYWYQRYRLPAARATS